MVFVQHELQRLANRTLGVAQPDKLQPVNVGQNEDNHADNRRDTSRVKIRRLDPV